MINNNYTMCIRIKYQFEVNLTLQICIKSSSKKIFRLYIEGASITSNTRLYIEGASITSANV